MVQVGQAKICDLFRYKFKINVLLAVLHHYIQNSKISLAAWSFIIYNSLMASYFT